MADLYGSNNESEDMSSFLQILLHNSSSSSAAAANNGIINSSGGFFTSGEAAAMAESDPSSFFNKDSDGFNHSIRMKNLNSSFEGSEGFELPIDPALPRSSKRTRAAEVHNLTEKRRRSRINEKLKALQKLIPNSNKTDKASMLDEAIEYLKQLQLQVQMLTLRNGLGAPPVYSLGSLQSMGVTPSGLELDEQNVLLNSNRGPVPHNVFTQGHIQTTNPTSSTHPMINTNSTMQPSYMPSTQNHYGLLNHLASSKDICRDDTFYRLQLDMSSSGNNSSPGVSS